MSAYSGVVLAKAPGGYWRFGDVGATALDSSGNGNDGSIQGTIQRGVAGAIVADPDLAMNFLGTSGNRVQVADAATLKPARISVEMWLQCNAVSTFTGPISKASSGQWSDGFGMYFRSGQGLGFWVNRYGGFSGGADCYDPGYPADGAFHHYVGTWDGANLRIYRDGVLRNTVAYSTAITYVAAAVLGIGWSGPSGAVWPSAIDEVAIYGAALTPAQVMENYRYGIGGYEPTINLSNQRGSSVVGQDLRASTVAGEYRAASLVTLADKPIGG